jgi:hypothetical protein
VVNRAESAPALEHRQAAPKQNRAWKMYSCLNVANLIRVVTHAPRIVQRPDAARCTESAEPLSGTRKQSHNRNLVQSALNGRYMCNTVLHLHLPHGPRNPNMPRIGPRHRVLAPEFLKLWCVYHFSTHHAASTELPVRISVPVFA